MAGVKKRRPLPALICLIALTLLTALVWWRVLHRGDHHAIAASPCTPTSTPTVQPRPPSILVSVLNSTQRAGLAKSTATSLARQGFKISGYGNDTGHTAIAGTAQIRYSPAQKTAATLLAYYFPGAKLVSLAASSDPTVVISLGTKFKALASSTAANRAMAADHVKLSPTATPTPTPTRSASC
jgi:hypothetical protein